MRKDGREEYFKKYREDHKTEDNPKIIKNTHERRKERSEWFHNYKSTLSCEKCGEKHPACIEFHHKDPKEKDTEVSFMVGYAYSMERILNEIAKCNVWCSNCHRKFHWQEQMKSGTSRYSQALADQKIVLGWPEPGTISIVTGKADGMTT